MIVTIVVTALVDALYYEGDHWKIEISIMIPLLCITVCACGCKESKLKYESLSDDDTELMFNDFLNLQTYEVLRNKRWQHILYRELTIGDQIKLCAGMQVPFDCLVGANPNELTAIDDE